jgi:hypothetical protein
MGATSGISVIFTADLFVVWFIYQSPFGNGGSGCQWMRSEDLGVIKAMQLCKQRFELKIYTLFKSQDNF